MVGMKKIPQDVVGDIAILKFKKSTPWLIKKLKARKFLKNTPHVSTVREKTDKFSGRLRTPQTKWLAGHKTSLAKYKENNCVFVFDVDETYFSPRLSEERKLTAEKISRVIKKDAKVLVMFSGVAPFPVVIAKTLRKKQKRFKIYANELNRKANGYAKKNIHLNKLGKYIELVPGDASKLPQKIKEKFGNINFDVILMTRPNLKKTYLDTALKLSRKGTVILYHGFGTKEKVLAEIKNACGKKIGKITIRKAGDIGKDAYRWLATFSVR